MTSLLVIVRLLKLAATLVLWLSYHWDKFNVNHQTAIALHYIFNGIQTHRSLSITAIVIENQFTLFLENNALDRTE